MLFDSTRFMYNYGKNRKLAFFPFVFETPSIKLLIFELVVIDRGESLYKHVLIYMFIEISFLKYNLFLEGGCIKKDS